MPRKQLNHVEKDYRSAKEGFEKRVRGCTENVFLSGSYEFHDLFICVQQNMKNTVDVGLVPVITKYYTRFVTNSDFSIC